MFKIIILVLTAVAAINATSIRMPEARFEVERVPTPSGKGFYVFVHNDNGYLPAMSYFSFKRNLAQFAAPDEKFQVEDMDTGKVLGTFGVADGGFSVQVPVGGVQIFRLTPA